MLELICYVAAVVLFLLAAIKVTTRYVEIVALGWACVALALLLHFAA